MNIRLSAIFSTILTVLFMATATVGADDAKVVIRGSHALYLTLEPHMDKIRLESGVNVDFSKPGGCGDAVKLVTEGGGVGAVCCPLDAAELARMGGAVLHPLALEPLMIIVNKSNRVRDLSADQVRQILSGQIVNWREVGGADSKIVVVMRPHCAPRPGHWKTILPFEKWKAGIVVNKFLTMITTVSKLPGAVGHLGSVLYDPKLMNVIRVDGVDPLDPAAMDKGYPFYRPVSLALPAKPSAAEKQVADYLGSDAAKQIFHDKYLIPGNRLKP